MICPNCKKSIKNNTKFCSFCGEKLTSINDEHEKQYKYSNDYSKVEKKYSDNHEEQYTYSENYSDVFTSTISSDEDYLKTYIGKNYDKIKSEKPSIVAFIFGPFYLLYRKLWLYALICFIVSILLIIYTNHDIFVFVQILIEIYLCLKFNNIYIQYSSRRIEEIKISNPDKTSKELLELCNKKGGTSKVSIILSIIISFFLLIILLANTLYKTELLQKQDPDIIINPIQMKDMSYSINESCKETKYKNLNYNSYSYIDSNSFCFFRIQAETSNTYKKPTDLLKINNPEYDKSINNQLKLNNIIWASSQYNDNDRSVSYYSALYKNTFYLIEAEINEDEYGTCNNIKNDLLDSIRFSK